MLWKRKLLEVTKTRPLRLNKYDRYGEIDRGRRRKIRLRRGIETEKKYRHPVVIK